MEDVTQTDLTGAPATTLTLKNQVRSKQIAQGIMEGKTYTQIAEEIGISRPALYAVMGKQEVQALMERELRMLETTVLDWIMELKNSNSKVDKRVAIQELAKITKHYADKLYPNLLRTENVNVNLDYEKMQTTELIHTETVSRMPVAMRNLYKEIYSQVIKEYA